MRKRTRRLGLAALLLLALGCTALWFNRIDVLTWALTRTLERQGLAPARFTIDAVDLRGLHARDVALRDGQIQLADVTISYAPFDLATARIGRVEIGGIAATLAIGKDGIELGGRPLAAGTSGNSPIAGLRIDALTIRDARFLLDSADGRIETTISATLALADGTIRGTALTADVSMPVTGTRHTVKIAAQRLALQPQAEGGARFSLEQAAVTLEHLPWAAEAVDAELALQPDRTTARLAVGRFVSRQQPMVIAPLSLTAIATLVGPRLDFTLHAETAGKVMAKMEAKGGHDRSSSSGSATIVLDPLVFHRGSVQPGDLVPALAGVVEDVEGSVSLGGSMRWSGSAVSPDLTLRIKDLAFAAPTAKLRALKGEIKISKLWPPATPPGQMLTATIEAAGMPPANLSLNGQLAPGPVLKLERAAIEVAGGEIVSTPFAIDPDAPEIDTSLQVDHVNLAAIMSLLSIEGLSGTGRLDGRVPVALKGGTITISGGRLVAGEPGVLSYRPGQLPPEIAGAGGSMELALQVLSDFRYDRLTLDLDKTSGGEGTVLLRLEGRNPAVMSGQTFNFNIRIDSNFDRLADYALLSLRSTQELLRRAAGRAGR